MTEAIYLEVTEKTEAAKKAGRQVSVSGMIRVICSPPIPHGVILLLPTLGAVW